tara:strand:+ start:2240 stop:2509 length:270 start_codon:yes stop_codon:yes gene_type:complete
MKFFVFYLLNQICSQAIPLLPQEPTKPLPIDYLMEGLAVHNPPLLGSPYDSNGCCISCGYTYCETLLECVRPWEVECPVLINPFIIKDK